MTIIVTYILDQSDSHIVRSSESKLEPPGLQSTLMPFVCRQYYRSIQGLR
jgi:hypothetical protein